MGAYFIYNGISSKDMGVILKKLPPITKPKKRIEIVQVPGRNGTLHIDENCYEPINISLWFGSFSNSFSPCITTHILL